MTEKLSIMFWLGYLKRKIYQDENIYKLKYLNNNQLEAWESKLEIKNFFINQAKQVKVDQEQAPVGTSLRKYRLDLNESHEQSLKKAIEAYIQM